MNTTLRWHRLASIHTGDELTELLAAGCDDGIGVIARWTRTPDGWKVEAMDTEGSEGMLPVDDFSMPWEEMTVPPEPPTEFDDADLKREIRDSEIALWVVRHGLYLSMSSARAAFEDAQTLHLTTP